MIYRNREYEFRFNFDPYLWFLKETPFARSFSIELLARSAPDVIVGIKVLPRVDKKRIAADYFETDKNEFQRLLGNIEIVTQKTGLHKGKNYHDVKFRASNRTFRRFLLMDYRYLYLQSLVCPEFRVSAFESVFENIVNSMETGPASIPNIEISLPEVSSNIFHVKLKEGNSLLTGDITLSANTQDILVNTIELQCIDDLGYINKDIFHQVGEITSFGRQAMPTSAFQFINTAPKHTVLNFLLPHDILLNPSEIIDVKICIYGRADNGDRFKKCISSPLKVYGAAREVRFPLSGKWCVINGPGLYGIHREAYSFTEGKVYSPQGFALDVVKVDDSLKSHMNDGNENDDYYAFGESVYAPLSGQIVDRSSNIFDNLPGDRNWTQAMGNYIVIQNRSDRNILLAHMKQDSISVKVGDTVNEGEEVGRVGNSGNSSEPHLHFHLSDTSDQNFSNGLPMIFKKYGFLLSGDIIQN